MSDYQYYDFTLTVSQLEEILNESDSPILVEINGMYYELKREEKKQ